LVLGPFRSDDLNTDFLQDSGGQVNIHPSEGDAVLRADGVRLQWTRLHADQDFVKLERAFGFQERAIAYAYCEIDSAPEADTDVRIWADHAAVLWINGQEIGRTPGHVGPKEIGLYPYLPATLRAGRNGCLVKIAQVRGEWQFLFQALSP